MVSVNILQQERAEALERLRDTLTSLDGADTEAVQQASERAGAGLVGRDYETALFLDQVASILTAQQERIAALEAQAKPSGASKGTSRRSKRSS
jgi:hypothetical protein